MGRQHDREELWSSVDICNLNVHATLHPVRMIALPSVSASSHGCIAVLMQAVDAIKKEALTLEELSAQATKQCTEKRIALRRLENQALERKNRYIVAVSPHHSASSGQGQIPGSVSETSHSEGHFS